MKTMMTTDVFRVAEVFIASTSTDAGPGLMDREVTGGAAGTPAGESTGELVDDTGAATKDETAITGEHEIVATNIEVNNIEVKNLTGVVRLRGFSDAGQTKQCAGRLAGIGRVRHGIRGS